MTKLGNLMEDYRIDNNLNKNKMSEKLSMTPAYYDAVVRGDRKLNDIHFIKLLDMIGFEEHELMEYVLLSIDKLELKRNLCEEHEWELIVDIYRATM